MTIGDRFNWSTTARGTRTVPVLLIAGIGAVFVPEGMAVTSCSLSGSIDSLWWPGASASFSGVALPWLSLPHGIAWSEQIIPADPQALDVGAVEVMLSDVDGAATALFASRDSVLATELVAEVSATDVTVHVVDTSAFASSGVIYLGREAIAYASKTSTTFAGCTRAQYGSAACRHPFAGAAGGEGIELPVVTTAAYDVVGRPASLWMATVSSAGIITAVELEFVGHVGVDAALADDSDAWLLRIDHAVHRLSQPPRSASVSVGGWVHTGNSGVRADARAVTASPIGRVAQCPLYLYVGDEIVGTPTYSVCLSDEAAFPDSGGWHPSRETFVAAMNFAANQAMTGNDIAVFTVDNGALTAEVRLATSGPHFSTLFAPWAGFVDSSLFASGAVGAAVYARWSVPEMPLAWVPIDRDSRVYLSPVDYAVVPTLPTNPAAGVDAHTELYYLLAFGADDAPRYARITDRAQASGVQYVVATALQTNDLPHAPTGVPDAVETGAAFTVREPTFARLALLVRSAHWVDAVHAFLVAQNSDAGDQLAESIDWNDMRAQVSAGGAIPLARNFIFDAKQSPLEWLVNECALGGFALVLRGGRISMARIAEFGVTETTAGTITTQDLVATDAMPGYSRGYDGIINRMTFKWPVGNRTLNVIDTSSRDKYGASRTAITASLPANVIPTTTPGDSIFQALWLLGMTTIGPHRRPAETVMVSLTLAGFSLEIGDVVQLTLWRVPNDQGGRGVTSVVGQVMARKPSLYGEISMVNYTIRLSPKGLTGWSPSILVRAAGISGAVVTADDTIFGASGFAQTGQQPTAGFAVGDKVRLVEINNASPTTATQHEVTGVSATTLTLSPSPNATFTAMCASELKAIVVFDDYDTSGLTTRQKTYAYLAPRATLLLAAGVRAQRIAA